MFKRIAHIKDFGVFNDFNGGTLPEFAKFNIIYGWNYSGKTTLSRVFRCLENGALHSDYPNARFDLTSFEGTQHNNNFANLCNVRVYNEDFRKDHIRWDETAGIDPILLLGAENIERRDELVLKETQRLQIDAQRNAAAMEAKRLEERISKAETECASEIVKELPVGRFNRTNLRPIINGWNGVLPGALTPEEVQSAHAKVSAEEKDILPDLSIAARSISQLWRDCVALLNEQIDSSATIDHLVNHPDIAAWVESGRQLHQSKTHCEFCEGVLSTDRKAALNAHFSDAFNDLKRRISLAIDELLSRRMEFSGSAYPRSGFYVDLHQEHTAAGRELALARDNFNSAVKALVDALNLKLSNPFDVVTAPQGEPESDPLFTAAIRFQKLVTENNDRTRRFASARNEAISQLKEHYAAQAMRRIDRFKLDSQISAERTKEMRAEDALAALNVEIAGLQAELSDATKGAGAINDTLRRFFGKADIQVKVVEGDRFQLMRGDMPARNLSEGERAAIAFCYFVTKLLENGNDLSQCIVYIDDPISSLDAHHLLNINAFIKNTFYKFDSSSNPKHQCLAKQVFVSTHNYEFFHLTWEWMSERTPKGFSAAYMVERTDSNGLVSSRLIECPQSILKYRSEYLFLYQQLANYLDSPTNDAQVIFNLGNMARRFVEGYLAFKFFEHSKIDLTLQRIIPDPVQCERARKFMHFHSHTLNRAGGMVLPDMSEAQSIVTILLEAVRNHDPIHYGSLEATR